MTQKTVDKEKINIFISVCVHRYLQTTIDYCRIAHPGNNSKSGLPIKQCSTSGILFLLFIQKPCQITARKIEINIISFVKRIFHLFIDPT